MGTEDDDIDESKQRSKLIEERNKRWRARELGDLKKVLSFAEGRRLVWRLMDEAGVFRTAFSPSNNQAFFNLGYQNMGLMLWSDLNTVAPERYPQMQREHISDLKSREEESKKT